MLQYLYGTFIGALAGILAGLCGVGGGVVMVPAFVLAFRMDQKTAVATSLAVIVLTALVGTVRNAGNQLVDWKIAVVTALASAVVVWFATDLLKRMSNLSLTRIFAISLVVMGLVMLVRSFGAGSSESGREPADSKESRQG